MKLGSVDGYGIIITPLAGVESVQMNECRSPAVETAATNERVTRFNDARLVGAWDYPEFGSKVRVIAEGLHKADKRWTNTGITDAQLLAKLSCFERSGTKDGRAILQGSVVTDGVQRIANNQHTQSWLMLDNDTGTPVAEVVASVQASGFRAVVWTTYSNGKPETAVAEKALNDWRRSQGRTGDVSAQVVADYLMDKQKTRPEIFPKDVISITRTHVEGGVHYLLRHAPMARTRILLWVATPYAFGDRPGLTQAQAIEDWKAVYAAVAQKIGLPFDKSCTDPSRLMYTPRIPKAAIIGDGPFDHQIWAIDGAPVDLDAIARVGPAKAASAKRGSVSKSKKTPWLNDVLRQYKGRVRAADLLSAYDPESSDRSDGVIGICPNPHGSGVHKADDLLAINWDTADAGVFVLTCNLHDTCKGLNGGDMLDVFIQTHCITREQFLEYVDRREETELDAEITAAIAAVTKQSTGAQIEDVLRLIAQRPAGIQDAVDLAALAKAGPVGKQILASTLKHLRRSLRDDGEEDRGDVSRAPIAGQEEGATCVRGEWDHQDQVRVARRILERENAVAPTLFKRPEGRFVRLRSTDEGTVVEEMENDYWAEVIGRHVEYRRDVRSDGSTINMGLPVPGQVTQEIRGAPALAVPTLQRFVSVPVFGPNGELNTEPGYDPVTQTYLLPNLDLLPVPDVVSDDDVGEAIWWLLEGLHGFPFSDKFDGRETLPIYGDEADADGWCDPNWDRGRGSRANMFALILQTFAQAMIDGPCHGYLVDKNSIGTGANFLLDVVGMIVLGKRTPVQNFTADEESFRKRMTAALLECASVIAISNIDRKVVSEVLASMLTANEYTDRILGVSRNATMKIRGIITLDGNQVKLKDDLVRRVCPIRIDAATNDPTADRPPEFFKHFPLHDWLAAKRPQLVWACHVIVRNWVQSGMPVWTGKPLASFEHCSRVLGGILECAGIDGYLSNARAYQDAKKETAVGDQQLVTDWVVASNGLSAATAADLVIMLQGGLGHWPYEHIVIERPELAARRLSEHIGAHIETRTFRLVTADAPNGAKTCS